MPNIHTILFSRQGEDTQTLLKIGLREGDTRDPVEVLIDVLTDWAIQTEQGRKAWRQDFNIGDLLSIGLSNLDIHRFMKRHDMVLIDSIDLNVRREDYDRILIRPDVNNVIAGE